MTSPDATVLRGLKKLKLELGTSKLEAFSKYVDLLTSWNTKINLTRVPPAETWKRHFLDSLRLLPRIQGAGAKMVIDIGSGAGFPGLPLKIACPDLSLTLVESNRKKSNFLERVVAELELEDCDVVCDRAENISKDPDYRGVFDVATCRAVAGTDELVPMMIPLVKSGGELILLKGATAHEEVEAAKEAISKAKAELVTIEKSSDEKLFGDGAIVIVRKR